jgi:hypothetical protein
MGWTSSGGGHWNAWGEVQRFQMDYRAIPTFTQHTGYAEVRRILSPRWYAASRVGYLRAEWNDLRVNNKSGYVKLVLKVCKIQARQSYCNNKNNPGQFRIP